MIARRVAAAWPMPKSWADRWAVGLASWISRGGRGMDSRDIATTPGATWRAPFRSPHHTASIAGLFGGVYGGAATSPDRRGSWRPGEVTLAHGGILLLDEYPEFSRAAHDCLKATLDTGAVEVHRRGRRIFVPARFRLIATATPCPCGYLTHLERACVCSATVIRRYQASLLRLLKRDDVTSIDCTAGGLA